MGTSEILLFILQHFITYTFWKHWVQMPAIESDAIEYSIKGQSLYLEESMTNALFKRGVGAKFSATSFLREYDRIIEVIHERKQECDHLSRNKKDAPKKFWSKYSIERQVYELYNIRIFRKFWKKMEDTTRLHVFELEKEKKTTWLKTKEPTWDRFDARESTHAWWICCTFHKDGILSWHILRVMIQLNVERIPDKYIIDKWRKNDHMVHSTKPPPIFDENSTLMYNVLKRKLVYVASLNNLQCHQEE